MFSLDVTGGSLLGGLNFVNCAIFVMGYALFYNAIPGKGVKKGIIFSLFIGVFTIFVPHLRIYLALNISPAVLIYWVTLDLIGYLLAGVITGVVYKKIPDF
jgi:hypothetical protein